MEYSVVTAPSPNAWKYLNSHVGNKFPLGDLPSILTLGRIGITEVGSYLGQLLENTTYLDSPEGPPLYPNPFNIARLNFTEMGKRFTDTRALPEKNPLTLLSDRENLSFGPWIGYGYHYRLRSPMRVNVWSSKAS
jgi:hypothetical protein